MVTKPKVSIVCISYNQEDYIRETLDGFIMQKTNFPFEIVIADDASTDKTADIIREYEKKNPKLFRANLRVKNVGVVSNIQSVLGESRGEYIAICEGDDFWTDPLKLQKQADFLDSHPDYGIVFHPVRVFFENGEEKDSIFPKKNDSNFFTLENLLKENYIQTNSVMYRRVEYANLSSEVMPFDWYLHLIHAKRGKIGFINQTMSAYRRHSEGLWWDMYNNTLHAWKQHGHSYLKLCRELMILFGDNDEYRKIINQHVARVFEAYYYGSLDDKKYNELASTAVDILPSATWAFAQGIFDEKKEREALAEGYKNEIPVLRRNIEELKLQNQQSEKNFHEAASELQQIKDSKMWRYASSYRVAKQRLRGFIKF